MSRFIAYKLKEKNGDSRGYCEAGDAPSHLVVEAIQRDSWDFRFMGRPAPPIVWQLVEGTAIDALVAAAKLP